MRRLVLFILVLLSVLTPLGVHAEDSDRWLNLDTDEVRGLQSYLDKRTIEFNKNKNEILYWIRSGALNRPVYSVYQVSLDVNDCSYKELRHVSYGYQKRKIIEFKDPQYALIIPEFPSEKAAAYVCKVLGINSSFKDGPHDWKLIKTETYNRKDLEYRAEPWIENRTIEYYFCTDYYQTYSNKGIWRVYIKRKIYDDRGSGKPRECDRFYINNYGVDIINQKVSNPILNTDDWKICPPGSLEEAILNETKLLVTGAN